MASQSNSPVGPRPPGDLNPRPEPALDFPDRDFGQMNAADYDAIGFLGGLEVHQQLLTRTKLFCRCPAGIYVEESDAEVLRHMRPTLSELGEYDGTALMEFKTRKDIVYLLERNTVCTYEMDDTPPFLIDEQAVRAALEISQLFGLDLVSELHVMRKQYLDGSIPTGFQRTVMVGLAGEIPFRVPELGLDRALRIRQLSLEEDSCREVSDIGHRITFRTDRLGMPLTETVTEPDLYTPWEMSAGGRLLAQVARASGKVRRGPGAARQDVNVSVAGGRRVEIKGVDNHRGMPRLVHIEAFRQLNLLRIREEMRRRGLEGELYACPDRGLLREVSPLVVDARGMLKHNDYAPLRHALDEGEAVAAVRLPGMRGLLSHRTQPGITFARELAGRVRVIACLTARPFMIHSDIDDYGISSREWKRIRRALRAERDDSIVVLWGPERDVDTAAREVLARAAEALVGIPSETRQAMPDGTTDFERILPGPDRMYPDTDTPPVPIPESWLVPEVELAERPWQREDRYVEAGLSLAIARALVASEGAELFDACAPKRPEVSRRLAHALLKRLPHLRREEGLEAAPEAERLVPLVRAAEEGRVRLEAFEMLFDRLALERGREASAIVEELAAREIPESEVEARFEAARSKASALEAKPLDALVRFAMGELMPGLLGRVDAAAMKERMTRALESAAGAPKGDAR